MSVAEADESPRRSALHVDAGRPEIHNATAVASFHALAAQQVCALDVQAGRYEHIVQLLPGCTDHLGAEQFDRIGDGTPLIGPRRPAPIAEDRRERVFHQRPFAAASPAWSGVGSLRRWSSAMMLWKYGRPPRLRRVPCRALEEDLVHESPERLNGRDQTTDPRGRHLPQRRRRAQTRHRRDRRHPSLRW